MSATWAATAWCTTRSSASDTLGGYTLIRVHEVLDKGLTRFKDVLRGFTIGDEDFEGVFILRTDPIRRPDIDNQPRIVFRPREVVRRMRDPTGFLLSRPRHPERLRGWPHCPPVVFKDHGPVPLQPRLEPRQRLRRCRRAVSMERT